MMGLVRRQAFTPESPRAVDPEDLMEKLDDPDPEQRREAALDLVGVPAAVPRLLARLGLETEPRILEAVLTTLATYDNETVAAALAVHLASDDADLRIGAAEALTSMPRSALTLMPGLLAAPDPDVRVMTVMILAGLPHPDAQSWLVRVITDDPHPNVVTAAIDALLPSATAAHVPVLEAAARRFPEDPFLSFTVQAMLPRLAGTARWQR